MIYCLSILKDLIHILKILLNKNLLTYQNLVMKNVTNKNMEKFQVINTQGIEFLTWSEIFVHFKNNQINKNHKNVYLSLY